MPIRGAQFGGSQQSASNHMNDREANYKRDEANRARIAAAKAEDAKMPKKKSPKQTYEPLRMSATGNMDSQNWYS